VRSQISITDVNELTGLITALRGYHSRLIPREKTDGYAHDVVEAIEYWCSLAERAIANDERVNYPERAKGQLQWLGELEVALSRRPLAEIPEYKQVFETATSLLELLIRIPVPPNGYLSVLKIIREQFGFLQTEYGFFVTDEQPTGMKFASHSVYVSLEHATQSYLSFAFGRTMEDSCFWLEDLLYSNGDGRYREVPNELVLKTEEDEIRWFGFVAEMLRTYGNELLRGNDKAFGVLRGAQKKRDEEYAGEMERLHGSKHGE
jgi:hypothetical protein